MYSVIIPTYNSEKTLRYCLESILSQTYKDFECLIVDYPETNHVRKIAESFSLKDNRLKYLVSSVKGVIAQRYLGIINSKGDFITFVDSDDIVHPNYLFVAHNIFANNSPDIVIFQKNRVLQNEIVFENSIKAEQHFVDKREIKKMSSNYMKYVRTVSLTGKVYKRKLVFKSLSFYNCSIDVKYWEDAIFSFDCFFNCENVCFVEKIKPYYYIINPHSVTSNTANMCEYLCDCIKVLKILEKVLHHHNIKNKRQLSFFVSHGIGEYIRKTPNLTGGGYNILIKYVKYNYNIRRIQTFKAGLSRAHKLIAFSYNLNISSKLILRLIRKYI